MQTLPTQDIDVNAIYLVPIADPQTSDNYAEYIYLNGVWEKLGETPIEIDLTDFVKNTDYATANKGGVIKSRDSFGLGVDNAGQPYSAVKTYEQYANYNNAGFISKGTLENVITGKGLVSNTDYATSNTGGVIKASTTYGITMYNGNLIGNPSQYNTYQNANQNLIISKGTLENVITGKGLVSDTDYATDSTAGVIKTSILYGTTLTNEGKLQARLKTYEQYSDTTNTSTYCFISKGTLENVITGKGLVSNTDYATSSTGGVIKTSSSYNTAMSNGALYAQNNDYTTYQSKGNGAIIGKGTLENVLAEYYKKQVVLTQAQYDQITPDANTLYFITD